jgi:hypothetical protein
MPLVNKWKSTPEIERGPPPKIKRDQSLRDGMERGQYLESLARVLKNNR